MATHDYSLANQSGASFRTDLNNALAAIQSNNSNSSSPATTVAYQWWADTTSGTLKIRNSANNAWVELLQLDGTLTLEDGSASTPALAFRDDLNTGIFSSAADTFNVATAGVERMELGATTIFNEDGADVDFRIEGDTEVNLFYVDAGNNKIGIGTATPSNLLHLKSGAPAIQFEDTGANGSAISIIEDNNGFIKLRCDTGNAGTGSGIGFEVDGSERMRLDSSGRLLLGTTSVGAHEGGNNFTIAEDGHCGMTIRSSTSTSGNIYFADGTSSSESARGEISYRHSTDEFKIFTSGTERVTINSSGMITSAIPSPDPFNTVQTNLTISNGAGNTGAGSKINFAVGNSQAHINSQVVGGNSNSGTSLVFGTSTGATAGSEMMRLVGLRILHNCTSNTGGSSSGVYVQEYLGHVYNAIKIRDTANTGTANAIVFVTGNSFVGKIEQTGSATTYHTSSDYRLKENEEEISDGITRLKLLKPYRFNWKKDPNTRVDGFFAHEVTPAVPEAVSGKKDEIAEKDLEGKNIKKGDPQYQCMDHSKLVPLLTAAIKEAVSKIEVLETKVAALEAA